MENPNAFIGRKTCPTGSDVAVALGKSARVWNELLAWLKDQGVECAEWKSVSPKYGWSLRPAVKKRIILHLSPCAGSFRVAFVLGDRAVVAAKASDLPAALREEIAEAKRYAEGTPVRFTIRELRDLAPVRRLVAIKMAN